MGFSTVQLGPMEVLSALQHAEYRLGREFMKEAFLTGTIDQHILPEDFDQEQTVNIKICLIIHPLSMN